eukprot:7048580-Prymnesium_polylepis.1
MAATFQSADVATAAAASSAQLAENPAAGFEAFRRDNSGANLDLGKRRLHHSAEHGIGDSPCGESCEYAADGLCDDGGSGSDYDVCPLGSDCTDCGRRQLPVTMSVCTDACQHSSDSFCDDGGAGSAYDACTLGEDCTDCGARNIVVPSPAQPPTPSFPPTPPALPGGLVQ